MNKVISHSLEETKKIAVDWLGDISALSDMQIPAFAGMTGQATVVGLKGYLGSGKTTFVQIIAKLLGVEETVTSPTFVIMKLYPTKHSRFTRLVHIDAYRLEKGSEVSALDFENVVSNPNNLVMIEWAENVKEALPEDTKFIEFEALGEGERSISY